MCIGKWSLAVGVVVIGALMVDIAAAEISVLDPVGSALEKLPKRQEMLELPVRVVDPDGKPVADARVVPWALRSAQGHGGWGEDDRWAGVGPKEVVTDEDGSATVLYPRYRNLQEEIRTIAVSLFVDHPDYAYADGLHIDVPLENESAYEIKLTAGVPLEVRPLVDGEPAGLENVFAIWSDGRSWQKGAGPEKVGDEVLRIPAMPPGKNTVLLVKLDGERASDFSKITEVELVAGEKKQIDVPLLPSKRVEGVLSENVPRPIRNGRVKVRTLAPTHGDWHRVGWDTWAPVQPDGSFTIDGWPADERLQLIALCDGFAATSGNAPDVVAQPPDPATDGFTRPQVFDPAEGERITIEMTPMARCVVKVVDEDDEPVAGVKVVSWPNVGWWNGGSQIYCDTLVRGERLVRERGYREIVDNVFPEPFEGETDARGKVTLELPAGHEGLALNSDVYELPAFLGRRDARVELKTDETTVTLLRVQPRGTEKLGEWDKLAGVVFGCSTREGRRICALPGVQAKMTEFEKRFREAKDQRDPQLLSEAYAEVADAFEGVGDLPEAAKWREKASQQAALVKP